MPRDTRHPYDVREVIARLVDASEFDEFKALYGDDARVRLCAYCGLPGRHHRQQRRAVLRVGAEGRALRRALQPPPHPARVPAEHHGVHGRAQVRSGRHCARRRQDGDRRCVRVGAEVHGHHRRLVRRRQLRHVRPRVRRPVPVDLAEFAHLGDGWRAGGNGARDRQARRSAAPRRAWARRRRARLPRRDPLDSTKRRDTRLRERAAVGRRRDRPCRYARVLALALARRRRAGPTRARRLTAFSGCNAP